MSAINSMFNYLAKGNQVTSRQARAMFKVDHIADVVYRLRNEGHSVYTNRVTLSDGSKAYAYRLGNPSNQFEKYFNTGHVARARKTLYRDAISVAMAA
jgi:Helix-turn-helix domain